MEIYASGTQVELSIPLVDRGGNAIDAASVSYRVINQAGVEVVAPANLATFQAGDTNAALSVTALVNTLAVGAVREARSVELTCIVAGNTVKLSHVYVIEAVVPLIAGINSFQSLELAKVNAMNVFHMDGWGQAPDNDKITALIEARAKIVSLNLAGVDLSELTEAEFQSLPAEFIAALQMAQVVEASDILGYTDSVAQKRNDGLMLDTIGEVKQMFRSGKPLETPICRDALRYLGKYISYSIGLGRA